MMLGFLAKRLIRAGITIIGISLLIFVAVRFTGDPTLALLPEDATAADIAEARATLGLDKPIWVQYGRFAQRAVQGEFGDSLRYNEPAFPIILRTVPATLQLALSAFILAKSIAILLGVLTAIKQGSLFDRSVRGFTILADSAPSFWVGMMLILLFSVHLQWLPASGRMGLSSMILPCLSIAIGSIAVTLRLTRSAMLDTLSGDYVKFLRSRGISTSRIIWKHALRNAAIPVVAMLGVHLVYLLAGTVIIETVFNWPGIGRLMVEALNARDFAVIQAGALFVSFVAVGLNLFVDLLFGIIDPRIRHG